MRPPFESWRNLPFGEKPSSSPAYDVGVSVAVGQKVGGSCDLGVQPWAGVAVGGGSVGVGVGRGALSFSAVSHGPTALLGQRTVEDVLTAPILLAPTLEE